MRLKACNLGVVLVSDLSLGAQATLVVQSCFIQLRHVTEIKSFLSLADLGKVIHALIPHTRVD